ncbi:MAG: YbjN domain-containing protein [Alphaproteobacteria bacterium]|nr:YbjN domain-containing protein [Alphaproteobacteria bacterium]
MEFGNEMQKNVYAMLVSWFGPDIQAGAIRLIQDRPMFLLQQGSAIVQITVSAMGDGEAVITVGAGVVAEAQITPELMLFLLAHNSSTWFGAFGLDPQSGVISFDHSIIGSTCDQKELHTSISAVAGTADAMDDLIIEKFGGKSALAMVTQ